jgi:hypothetical protein
MRHAITPRSHRERRGASSLPHTGGVHRIKVPIKVATLATTPLPLALNGDVDILTQVMTLEFNVQIHCSETCYTH